MTTFESPAAPGCNLFQQSIGKSRVGVKPTRRVVAYANQAVRSLDDPFHGEERAVSWRESRVFRHDSRCSRSRDCASSVSLFSLLTIRVAEYSANKQPKA